MKDMLNKIVDVLKAISAILAAIILIAGQISEIGDKAKVLKETFVGSADSDTAG